MLNTSAAADGHSHEVRACLGQDTGWSGGGRRCIERLTARVLCERGITEKLCFEVLAPCRPQRGACRAVEVLVGPEQDDDAEEHTLGTAEFPPSLPEMCEWLESHPRTPLFIRARPSRAWGLVGEGPLIFKWRLA